ncbi:hypothetical protein NDU88_005279 [Pleurodeles waltl]|uniref:Uncharacterized protein n=1 Tax=Pleurodeles waltl TaxID=8319 RepID=A0AAV7QET5_PLEWA|nr:hypothetical protein NDU88_005279 [Pleurodeles waltl]
MSTQSRKKSRLQRKERVGGQSTLEMAEPVPHSLQLTLDKILGAIEESKTTLQREICQVSVELGLLRADHQKLADRVREAETTLTGVAPAQQSLEPVSQLYSKLFNEAERIRRWKGSIESEIQSNEKKLHDNKRTIDAQRKAIQELQASLKMSTVH